MKKFSFLVRDLGHSQLTYYLVTGINKFLGENSGYDICIFYQNLVRPMVETRFAIMNAHEAWGYTNPLISTDLVTTSNLLRYFGCRRKFFYVYDLEWLHILNKNYSEYANLYRDSSLTLLCRSESHKKILLNNFDKEVKVVGDFNINKIAEIVHAD